MVASRYRSQTQFPRTYHHSENKQMAERDSNNFAHVLLEVSKHNLRPSIPRQPATTSHYGCMTGIETRMPAEALENTG